MSSTRIEESKSLNSSSSEIGSTSLTQHYLRALLDMNDHDADITDEQYNEVAELIHRANTAFNQQDYANCIELILKAKQNKFDIVLDGEATGLLSMAYYMSGDLENALKAIIVSKSLYEMTVKSYELIEALIHIRQSNFVDAHKCLALVMSDDGEYQEVEAQAQKKILLLEMFRMESDEVKKKSAAIKDNKDNIATSLMSSLFTSEVEKYCCDVLAVAPLEVECFFVLSLLYNINDDVTLSRSNNMMDFVLYFLERMPNNISLNKYFMSHIKAHQLMRSEKNSTDQESKGSSTYNKDAIKTALESADLYRKNNNVEKEIACLEEALASVPDNRDLILRYVDALCQSKSHGLAIIQLCFAINLTKQYGNKKTVNDDLLVYYRKRRDIFASLKKYSLSDKDHKKITVLIPESERNTEDETYLKMKRLIRSPVTSLSSTSLSNREEKKATNSTQSHFLIARDYYLEDKLDEALTVVKEVLTKLSEGDAPSCKLMAAMIYARQNNMDESRRLFASVALMNSLDGKEVEQYNDILSIESSRRHLSAEVMEMNELRFKIDSSMSLNYYSNDSVGLCHELIKLCPLDIESYVRASLIYEVNDKQESTRAVEMMAIAQYFWNSLSGNCNIVVESPYDSYLKAYQLRVEEKSSDENKKIQIILKLADSFKVKNNIKEEINYVKQALDIRFDVKLLMRYAGLLNQSKMMSEAILYYSFAVGLMYRQQTNQNIVNEELIACYRHRRDLFNSLGNKLSSNDHSKLLSLMPKLSSDAEDELYTKMILQQDLEKNEQKVKEIVRELATTKCSFDEATRLAKEFQQHNILLKNSLTKNDKARQEQLKQERETQEKQENEKRQRDLEEKMAKLEKEKIQAQERKLKKETDRINKLQEAEKRKREEDEIKKKHEEEKRANQLKQKEREEEKKRKTLERKKKLDAEKKQLKKEKKLQKKKEEELKRETEVKQEYDRQTKETQLMVKEDKHQREWMETCKRSQVKELSLMSAEEKHQREWVLEERSKPVMEIDLDKMPVNFSSRGKAGISPYEVMTVLLGAGYEAYDVGGSLVSLLRGEAVQTDYDIVTNATQSQILALFKSYGIIQRQYKPDLFYFKGCEKTIDLFSSKNLRESKSQPKELLDLKTRGLTMCALVGKLVNVQSDKSKRPIIKMQIFDYLGNGYSDARKGHINTLTHPDNQFGNEEGNLPFRVLIQGAKGYEINPRVETALTACKDEVKKYTPHVLNYNMYKLLCQGHGENGAKLLFKYGYFETLFNPVMFKVKENDDFLGLLTVLKHVDEKARNYWESEVQVKQLILSIGKFIGIPEKFLLNEKKETTTTLPINLLYAYIVASYVSAIGSKKPKADFETLVGNNRFIALSQQYCAKFHDYIASCYADIVSKKKQAITFSNQTQEREVKQEVKKVQPLQQHVLQQKSLLQQQALQRQVIDQQLLLQQQALRQQALEQQVLQQQLQLQQQTLQQQHQQVLYVSQQVVQPMVYSNPYVFYQPPQQLTQTSFVPIQQRQTTQNQPSSQERKR